MLLIARHQGAWCNCKFVGFNYQVYPNPGTLSNKYPGNHPVNTTCTIQTQPVSLPIGFLRTNNKKNSNQRISQAAQHKKEKDLDNQLLPFLESFIQLFFNCYKNKYFLTAFFENDYNSNYLDYFKKK
ncbi:MAG: hypothetical protein MUD14_08450 [Hydrococcus sp. Prado102]|nr:hypothetical protein [Hydrococcus sp. Prado102]